MSRGSKHHYIQTCKFCDEMYCQTCSEAEDQARFCSAECELGDQEDRIVNGGPYLYGYSIHTQGGLNPNKESA